MVSGALKPTLPVSMRQQLRQQLSLHLLAPLRLVAEPPELPKAQGLHEPGERVPGLDA